MRGRPASTAEVARVSGYGANYGNYGKERSVFICSLLFLAGGILGGISGRLISQGSARQIRGGLEFVLSGGEPNLSAVLLDNFMLPLLSLFLATSVIGWLLAPLVVAARGYMLGWAISSAISAAGAGIGVYIYYGLPPLVTVPCLIYLTASSMSVSKGISDVVSQRSRPPSGSLKADGSGRQTAACLILLLAVSVAQTYLMPSLLRRL
jgi:hypothetical protein